MRKSVWPKLQHLARVFRALHVLYRDWRGSSGVSRRPLEVSPRRGMTCSPAQTVRLRGGLGATARKGRSRAGCSQRRCGLGWRTGCALAGEQAWLGPKIGWGRGCRLRNSLSRPRRQRASSFVPPGSLYDPLRPTLPPAKRFGRQRRLRSDKPAAHSPSPANCAGTPVRAEQGHRTRGRRRDPRGGLSRRRTQTGSRQTRVDRYRGAHYDVGARREHWGAPRRYVRDPADNPGELTARPPRVARDEREA